MKETLISYGNPHGWPWGMSTLDPDTVERLNRYAKDHHTNVSQAITDWIWKQEVSEPQIEGQADRKEILKGLK